MVQLQYRAVQLVKHLELRHVNGPDGKDVIFKAVEKSPIIKQRSVDERCRCSGQIHVKCSSRGLPKPPVGDGRRLGHGRSLLA